MNRDEQRLRHESNKIRTLINDQTGSHSAFPIDNKTGGTWFGMNDSGIVLALLNRYQNPLIENAVSRGEIIPGALAEGSFNEVFDYCGTLPVKNYNPFDLILISELCCYRFKWNGARYKIIPINAEKEFFITSSSVTTDFVLKWRKTYFKKWLKKYQLGTITEADILTKLHLQQEIENESRSIFMSRQDSHTKSISQVCLTASILDYQYLPEKSLVDLNDSHDINYSQLHSLQLPLHVKTA